MSIASTVARYLMGVVFVVFGLNGFLHFIPQPPPPAGAARDFLGALAASHFLVFVFGLQFVCGMLFLVNRFVPLALVLIAPVIVNILLFHGLMDPKGIVPGLIVTVLWALVAYRFRSAFAGLLLARPKPDPV